jgi:hypothetical protein
MKILLLIFIPLLINACSSNPPKESHNNICHIYEYDDDWEDAAKESAARWGTPEYILMAFIHQESRFKDDAQPPRPYALGFIPLPRRSSSYGYSQAQDPVWLEYQRDTGNSSARRSDVEDSLDFIGWYNYQSHKKNRISRHDAYRLYLAYHEGQGGFQRRTYLKKHWLLKVAKKVQRRAYTYKQQLKNCSRYKSYEDIKNKRPPNNNSCNAPWPYC